MQAKLPDVNAALVRYRSHAIECFTHGDYTGATLSLGTMNALLPEDYRVDIDDRKFQTAVQTKSFVICPQCKTETPTHEIKYEKILLSSFDKMLTGQEYEESWFCKKCDDWISKADTNYKRESLSEPYYLGVVPRCPQKRDGLIDHTTYDNKFKKWFAMALAEMECKIGKYRADYLAQQGDDQPMGPEEG